MTDLILSDCGLWLETLKRSISALPVSTLNRPALWSTETNDSLIFGATILRSSNGRRSELLSQSTPPHRRCHLKSLLACAQTSDQTRWATLRTSVRIGLPDPSVSPSHHPCAGESVGYQLEWAHEPRLRNIFHQAGIT